MYAMSYDGPVLEFVGGALRHLSTADFAGAVSLALVGVAVSYLLSQRLRGTDREPMSETGEG